MFGGRFGAEAGGAGGAGEVVEGEEHVIVFSFVLPMEGISIDVRNGRSRRCSSVNFELREGGVGFGFGP